jgi:3-dehydroquinate dehydratase type I
LIINASFIALDSDRDFLASIICASAKFKANVVTLDEREGGLRGLLNFGHSIGHAFEAVLSPDWLHGECVSVGLVLEAQLSFNLGHCSPQAVNRLANCLRLYNLPTVFDTETKNKLKLEQVMQTMKVDKKNKGAQKRIVLLSGIGSTLEQKASDVPDDAVEHVVKKSVSSSSSSQKLNKKSAKSTIKRQQQPLIPHPTLKLISTSIGLDAIIQGLYNILKNRFQCAITTSEEESMSNTSEADEVFIYFTSKAGSTVVASENDRWHEYVVLPNEMGYHFYNGAMAFITDVVCGQEERHINPLSKKPSAFVTPTISDYEAILPVVLDQWLEGADAIEYRVDLLQAQKTDKDWISTAGTQLAHLRQKTKLPIVYTVRTSPQAGKFDLSLVPVYLELVQWGQRWGCDYVDAETTTLSEEQLDQVMELNKLYPSTKIIASYHDPEHMYTWHSSMIKEVYDKAHQLFQKFNHAGVIKVVGFAETFWDNIQLEQFRHKVDPENNRALIFINMGPHGRFSRVANRFMSPTTHPALPFVAAPGQLSIAELSHIRNELFMN